MSPLAHRRFLKMNGLGNEIVVLDLRGSDVRVQPAEARAIAADPASRFDQMMVLHDPVTPGTDAFVRIYNTDGSEAGACGNGTRCVAWAMLDDPAMARPPLGENLLLETRPGLLAVVRVSPVDFTVDMGRPRLRWDEIPLAEPFPDTRRIELQVGPIDDPVLHSPGRSAWATRTRCSSSSATPTATTSPGSGRCSNATRSSRTGPTSPSPGSSTAATSA